MSGLRGTGPCTAGVRYPEFDGVFTGAAVAGTADWAFSGAAALQLLKPATPANQRNPRREKS